MSSMNYFPANAPSWVRPSDEPATHRILSRDDCERIIQKVFSLTSDGGKTLVRMTSWWNGELRWARNRATVGADRRDILIMVRREMQGGQAALYTNQHDDVSLESTVRAVERLAILRKLNVPPDKRVEIPTLEKANPTTWSDATFNETPEARGELARTLSADAEAKSMLSAGYLEMRAGTVAQSFESDKPELRSYYHLTQAQCSMTVRHPKGVGSGWAGLSSFDWGKIDGTKLARLALDKCMASLNPVRIEPGRYTVILEPQAVCDLLDVLWLGMGAFSRGPAEQGVGPFTLGPDHALKIYRTKLGLRVADERITLSHNLSDPSLGVLPTLLNEDKIPVRPITWIEHGVLKALTYVRNDYALPWLNDTQPGEDPGSYRMSGGETPVDEMIQSTKRGLLVTRFSNFMLLDPRSYLATGVTRDGLWLIENGKISKAVQNMRVSESPVFVLNQIDQLGVPVPVFRPDKGGPWMQGFNLRSAIVPPLKANDFSFTSTIDAI